MSDRQLDLVARGVLAGEAMTWTDAAYRIRLLPPKRLARMEVLAAFAREHETTTPAVAYSHSSPVAVLEPAPGEVVEWFAFSARALRSSREAGSFDALHAAWRDVADEAGPSRIGTRIPLGNLRRGLEPPHSGNDNPHYFDDLPMVRAVAAAAIFEGEDDAREAARRDAQVTGALDGVWCAEATAVLFSRLQRGAATADAIAGALEALPAETWSRRMAEESLAIAASTTGALDRAQRLSAEVGDRIYSYATVAPETLAFLLAHLARASSADDLILGVLAQPRNAATLPALAGAAAALLFGDGWMPTHLHNTAPLPGIGIPSLRGMTFANALTGTPGATAA